MIDMKDQCFGVEVEFTGITREQAATALARYFGTLSFHRGGTYDTWIIRDTENKEWKHRTVMRELETGITGWRWFPPN